MARTSPGTVLPMALSATGELLPGRRAALSGLLTTFRRNSVLTEMDNLDMFSKIITTAIPDATLAVQDGHVQATAYIKGIGQRPVGCSVANAEKAPRTMANRVIEAFSKTDWTQNDHVFLMALLPDGAP
jgi:hypothetical protein